MTNERLTEALGITLDTWQPRILVAGSSTRWMRPWGTGQPADPEPEQQLNPRDRALRALQTRNTGPDRPPAGQARRPRRHGDAR